MERNYDRENPCPRLTSGGLLGLVGCAFILGSVLTVTDMVSRYYDLSEQKPEVNEVQEIGVDYVPR